MDQFKSNKETIQEIPLPRRTITLEFLVGIFTLITVAAAGYLAVGLGDIRFVNTGEKYITAEFNNVSGLKPGASVELAGVPVGTVDAIQLKGYFAEVVLRINRDFDLKDEDNLSIRTKGIIGDRYVKIVPGGSQVVIKDGGKVPESNTLSVIDFEELIEKVVSHYSDDSNGKDAK